MPLFVDEEGRTYYSVNSLNPVTGRYSFPMHFNGAPGEPPVQRGPLLRLPEAAFGRALLWGTLPMSFCCRHRSSAGGRACRTAILAGWPP